MKQIGKLAPTELSVLVLGETGTGKELVARHYTNKAHNKMVHSCPLTVEVVKILESELFWQQGSLLNTCGQTWKV